MKIINWNCKMSFRKKHRLLIKYYADIMIIPECEQFTISSESESLWVGENPSKGLGIFSFNGFKIELHNSYTDKFKFIVPLIITRDDETYHVMAVWTKKVGPKKKNHKNYINQFRLSLNHYNSFLSFRNIIIAGDFNSNLLWKRKNGIILDKNHEEVIQKLEQINIYSAYHQYFNQQQGKESKPTYFHYHQKERPFHIDFCFLSHNLVKKLSKVEVGDFKDWKNISDHVPMITEF